MIETEQRLQRASELMAERERHRTDEKARETALTSTETRGLALSGEQRAAFDHATDGGGLSVVAGYAGTRSEEHTSELQSLMRISYAVFCLKKETKRRYSANGPD